MAYTTIDKPTDYFNIKLYTGNATNPTTISGIGFQPDWVWTKLRAGGTEGHRLCDSVRGATKDLLSNTTSAESTNTIGLKSFNSDGYVIGNSNGYNLNSGTFVSWNWLAGTSASGNTTGSGTAQSYTESYSTTAGFSIIAFTGNGTANHTLPHNLGVAPDWFIIKKRVGTGDATVRDWNVYHSSLGNTKRIALNSTGAVSTSSEYWNDTSPTSSVINLGTNDQINGNNNTYICYAFAEKKGYSKFGSYTGNGNTDGTFIYLGFKPAWFVVKPSSGTTGGWTMYDNAREPVNDGSFGVLTANSSNQELTELSSAIDFTSNGVKIRGGSGSSDNNASGATYIYMAFAESPFVSSGGIPTTAR